MDLVIYFQKIGEIQLKLKRGQTVVDTLDFSFQSNLDDLLTSSIDKILIKNKIETLSLKIIKIEGDIDKNSSAYKIALAFIKAWIKARKWQVFN